MRGRFRKTKRVLFRTGVRFLGSLARSLPRTLALSTFARIGTAVRWIDRPAVRRARAGLSIAFGDTMTAAERDAILREMFRALGRNLVDLLRSSRRDPEWIADHVDVEGLEHLEQALARGRGVVALSAHLGNWELLGATLATRGLPVSVVAQDVFEAESNRRLNEWRRAWGVRVFPRAHGLFGPARALREGWVVGALVDQDTGGASIHRDFFGRPARTTVAPFRLARRTGAALVPMWIHLGSDGRHRVTIRPPLPPEEALPEEVAIPAWIDAWHRELEGAIRCVPAQWVWFHPRWKTPPTDAERLRESSKKEPYLQRFQTSTDTVIAR